MTLGGDTAEFALTGYTELEIYLFSHPPKRLSVFFTGFPIQQHTHIAGLVAAAYVTENVLFKRAAVKVPYFAFGVV